MTTTHSTITAVPKLLLVTDRHATAGRDLAEVVERALDAGLPAVQLRDKELPGRVLFALAERLRAATARTGARFYVNDRVDVARAVGADGVQLGAASLPVPAARRLLGDAAHVGYSAHTLDELRAAAADFVLFGPVYDTPSKRAYGTPQGVAGLRAAVAAASVPVLAIGGVTASHVAELRATGTYGIAVVRAILAEPDPARPTRRLLAALAGATPSTSIDPPERSG